MSMELKYQGCEQVIFNPPSCLVSTVQAGGGGVMVWGIFS